MIEWISAEKELPEANYKVLLYDTEEDVSVGTLVVDGSKRDWDCNDYHIDFDGVTYWAEINLPGKPAKKGVHTKRLS